MSQSDSGRWAELPQGEPSASDDSAGVSTLPAQLPVSQLPAVSGGTATLAGTLAEDPARPRPATKSTSKVGGLYRAVWRWHFYAGLLTAPILWVIALTGAMYAFKTELECWKDRDVLFVEPQAARLNYDELATLAGQHLEKIEGIAAFNDPRRTVRFVGHRKSAAPPTKGRGHDVLWLNPYTGDMLDLRDESQDFFEIVLDLHRSLMLGTTGRVLSELVTSWTVILLLTGAYLWWPRGKKNVGVWLPRMRGPLYSILRDWHAVAGAYLLPIAILVTFTGLFFTVVWGSAFNATVQKAGHWAPQWFVPVKSEDGKPGDTPASLAQVIPAMLALGNPDDCLLFRNVPDTGLAHRAFLIRDEDKYSLRSVVVDRYSGRVMNVAGVPDIPALYQLRVLAVSIHMGKILGTPTKILALLASLGVFGLSVTGLWMWWKRRPRGRSGFPREPESGAVPAWGWLIVIVTSLIMPVAGASILLFGLGELLLGALRRRKSPAAV